MMEEHQANLTFTLGGGKNEKEVYESQVCERSQGPLASRPSSCKILPWIRLQHPPECRNVHPPRVVAPV